MCDDAFCFVVVVPACIHVSIETREVTARYLKPNAMARLEEVAGGHRLQRNLVDLPGLEPGQGLVVSVSIPEPLDRLVQIVGATVGINVD